MCIRDRGIQGPAGPAGSSIVPKFKVDADSYWMVSVDEGGTYEYVLNDCLLYTSIAYLPFSVPIRFFSVGMGRDIVRC